MRVSVEDGRVSARRRRARVGSRRSLIRKLFAVHGVEMVDAALTRKEHSPGTCFRGARAGPSARGGPASAILTAFATHEMTKEIGRAHV